MSNNISVWDIIFKPLTDSINDLRAEVAEVKNELHQVHLDLQAIAATLPPLPAIRFIFSGQIEGQEKKENITMLLLTDTQKASLSIAPVDAKGNPAKVQDGSVVWSAADSTIVTLTPSADGLSCDCAAAGPLGTTQVNVSADADLGDGVTTIAGTLDVQVQAGQAVSLGISAGTPVEQ